MTQLVAKNESAEHIILKENNLFLNKLKSNTGDSVVFCKYKNTPNATIDIKKPSIINLFV